MCESFCCYNCSYYDGSFCWLDQENTHYNDFCGYHPAFVKQETACNEAREKAIAKAIELSNKESLSYDEIYQVSSLLHKNSEIMEGLSKRFAFRVGTTGVVYKTRNISPCGRNWDIDGRCDCCSRPGFTEPNDLEHDPFLIGH